MMNRVKSFMLKNKSKLLIGLGVFAFMLMPIFNKKNILTMITNFGSTSYNEEIKSIDFESSDYQNNEPGSWHVKKSAEWIDIDKAEVTFEIDTKHKYESENTDVVFIIDISNSMNGGRIEQLKRDSEELVHYILGANPNNRMAVISFNSTSQIELDFSSDADTIIDKINSLVAYYNTNYYLPLVDLDKLLSNYQKQDGRDLITLFLTDGFPNEDTPKEIEQYQLIKEKYPYMVVNGVQYEMGNEVRQEVKNVSDNQFIASRRDLLNTLKQATIRTEKYNEFLLTDYIDTDYFDFYEISPDDLENGFFNRDISYKKQGDDQTIIINTNKFYSGFRKKVKFIVKLKDQYLREPGFYPTNKSEKVDYEIGNIDTTVTSNKTPILEKKAHTVTYNPNTPEGCNINGSSEQFVTFDKVSMRTDTLSCDGYIFKGWKVVQNIEKINDETFIMPDYDVEIKGTWAKQSVNKKMDGKIKEKLTLYKEVVKDYNDHNNVVLYSGQATDTYDNSASGPVYIYKGPAVDNNVIFANYCWKMVRTTQTGGVKLIYNGTPNEGKCDRTGNSDISIGFSEFSGYYNQYTFEAYGYMYNKIYYWNSAGGGGGAQVSGALYGNDVTYDPSSHYYTLVDPQTTMDETHHYSCNNTTGKCYDQVRYFFDRTTTYFVFLNYGDKIEDMVHNTFHADDVNTTNSAVKTKIDKWYRNNLLDYTDQLEDTVFCNDRSISTLGAFDKDNDNSWRATGIMFNGMARTSRAGDATLYCQNVTDRFSVNNSKAKLTYPIALPTTDEIILAMSTDDDYYGTFLGEGYLTAFGQYYLAMTPGSFKNIHSTHYISGTRLDTFGTNQGSYVRPMISLKKDTVYNYGDGSINNPFVIE